jgi:hypothetical protein
VQARKEIQYRRGEDEGVPDAWARGVSVRERKGRRAHVRPLAGLGPKRDAGEKGNRPRAASRDLVDPRERALGLS